MPPYPSSIILFALFANSATGTPHLDAYAMPEKPPPQTFVRTPRPPREFRPHVAGAVAPAEDAAGEEPHVHLTFNTKLAERWAEVAAPPAGTGGALVDWPRPASMLPPRADSLPGAGRTTSLRPPVDIVSPINGSAAATAAAAPLPAVAVEEEAAAPPSEEHEWGGSAWSSAGPPRLPSADIAAPDDAPELATPSAAPNAALAAAAAAAAGPRPPPCVRSMLDEWGTVPPCAQQPPPPSPPPPSPSSPDGWFAGEREILSLRRASVVTTPHADRAPAPAAAAALQPSGEDAEWGEAAAAKPAAPPVTTKPSALVAVRSLDAPDSLVAGPGAGQLGVAYRAELAPAALPPVPLARPRAGPVPLRFPLVAVPANAATHRPAADW